MRVDRRSFLRQLGAAGLGLATPTWVRAAAKEHVVVVGGGFAGATVAKYLRLWGDGLVDVTLVEPQLRHASCVLSNLVLNDQVTLDQLSFSYLALTEKYGIKVLRDRAEEIDAAARRIRPRSRGWMTYDRLVLAPGIAFDAISGLDPAKIPHAWIAGDSTTLLHSQLRAMPAGGTFVMTVPPAPYRCPPGPYERACLVADYLKRNDGGRVIVLDANSDIQAERETFSRAFSEVYGGIIDYRTNISVTAVDSDARILTTSTGNVSGDVVNVIPAQRAPALLQSAGLTAGTRWAPVNPLTYESTLAGYAGVYILGDAQNTGRPKSAHMANSQAKICADAILRSVNGLSNDLAERVDNITTNSACYSPITLEEASWLTANFAYSAASQSMQLTHIGASDRWSRENYQDMFVWANNLFSDTFDTILGGSPDYSKALIPIWQLLLLDDD